MDKQTKIDENTYSYVRDTLQCWLRSTFDSLINQQKHSLQVSHWPLRTVLNRIGELTITRPRHTRYGEWQCDTLLRYACMELGQKQLSSKTIAKSITHNVNNHTIDEDNSPIDTKLIMDKPLKEESLIGDKQEFEIKSIMTATKNKSITKQEQAEQWCCDIITNLSKCNGSEVWLSLINISHIKGYINFRWSHVENIKSKEVVGPLLLPPHPYLVKNTTCYCSYHNRTTTKLTESAGFVPFNHKISTKSNTTNTNSNRFMFQSIGTISSIYREKHGTPRQGSIAPLSRGRLIFNTHACAQHSLEGLEEYSHVWLIFVFHANTNQGIIIIIFFFFYYFYFL